MYPKTLLMLAYLFIFSLSYAHASSVREVTMDEMLQNSEFVFEGLPISMQAEQNSQGRIHTFVTFDIIEIIKGDYPDATITLSFLGGTVGGVTMRVSDMQFPEIGEHGIFFVESLTRSQVHPLFGWSQGHFLVEPDETGIRRIKTSQKQLVKSLEFAPPAQQNSSEGSSRLRLSNGKAYGISLAPEKNSTEGLTLDEFKKALYDRLDKNNE